MKPIIVLSMAVLLSACGTFKKTTSVEKEASKTEVTTKATETKTVTEKLDTTITTQADTAKASAPAKDILSGDTLKAETEFTTISVVFNPETGKIDATAVSKPREIPINIDRTTIAKTELETVAKTETETESVHIDKERKSGWSAYLWGVISILLLLILLYLLYRYIKSKI